VFGQERVQCAQEIEIELINIHGVNIHYPRYALEQFCGRA
jgi:hypothetical protein